jgi:hypothetical protein
MTYALSLKVQVERGYKENKKGFGKKYKKYGQEIQCMQDELNEKAKKMYESGMSIREIAKQLNLSYSKTRRILKDSGVEFRGKTPQSVVEKVIEMGKQGYSANKISKMLELNSNTVLRILKKHKLVKTKRRMSQDKIEKIKEMYINGYSIYRIAKELSISTNLVVYYLKKLNLKN